MFYSYCKIFLTIAHLQKNGEEWLYKIVLKTPLNYINNEAVIIDPNLSR